MFLMVSCGSSSKNDDASDTGDTMSDEDDGTADTEPSGDTEPAGDTESTEETESDDTDSGDTVPNEDDSDTVPADPCDTNPCSSVENSTGECVTTEETTYSCKCRTGYAWTGTACESNSSLMTLPECSSSSETPCLDSSSGFVWSAATENKMDWQSALDYCSKYSEGEISGWHLPTINELRTLLQDCPNTEIGGACGVTDECLSYTECWNNDCYCSNDLETYSKFGETGWLWSSSANSDNADDVWIVIFNTGRVSNYSSRGKSYFRCVR